MYIKHTKKFVGDFAKIPKEIKKKAEKQFEFLLNDSHHPSLRIKKMKGFDYIWEGRISDGYRFTFQIEGDVFILRRIGTHDVLKKP